MCTAFVLMFLLLTPAAPAPQAADDSPSARLARDILKTLDELQARSATLLARPIPAAMKGSADQLPGKLDVVRAIAGGGSGFYAASRLQDLYTSLAALEYALSTPEGGGTAEDHAAEMKRVGAERAQSIAAIKSVLAADGRPEALSALAGIALYRSELEFATAPQWNEAGLTIGFYFYVGESEGFREFAAWCTGREIPVDHPGDVTADDAKTLIRAIDRQLIDFTRAHGYQKDKHAVIVQADMWIETAKQMLAYGDPVSARFAALNSAIAAHQLAAAAAPDVDAVKVKLSAAIPSATNGMDDSIIRLFSERARYALSLSGDELAANLSVADGIAVAVLPRLHDRE